MSVNSVSLSQDFAEVLGYIQQTRQRVFAQANTALIDLYWRIGQTLSQKVAQAGWGKGVVTELARYIAQTDPTIHGFSDKNLWRMKQFYEAYQGDEPLSALARVLPWTHNTTIFSRCKSPEERRFYLALCQQEKYTSRELERQIDAASFERATLSPPKLSAALRVLQPAVGEVFKDRYVLEFLGLPEPHSEKDLVKKPQENPSIGVLLCRDKDDEVVEYALSRNLSPALVAQYQLQLPDKKLIAARMHEVLAGHEGVGDE